MGYRAGLVQIADDVKKRMAQIAQLLRPLIAAEQDSDAGAGAYNILADHLGVGVRGVDYPAGALRLQPLRHLLPLHAPAAYLATDSAGQLLAGGGRHRQGVAHAGGVQLLADRPRIAGAPDNQHVAVVHSA